MATSLARRSDVDRRFTWNAESVFEDGAGWDAAVNTILTALPDLAEFKGHLSESPDMLADWLEASERLDRLMDKVRIYSTMEYSCDVGDPTASAHIDRARSVAAQLGAAEAFALPEMLAIGFPKLRQWVETSPRLSHLGHYLDRLEKLSTHIRSAEVEEVLTQVSDPMNSALQAHSVLANTDMKFAPAVGSDGSTHKVAQGTIAALMTSGDRELRRTAFESYADAHLAAQHAMAASLSGGVKRDVFIARARRFGSSLEAAVTPSHIPVEVFHNTITTFRENLGTWHRYWRIARHLLGVDEMKPFDTRAQLSKTRLEVPYSQAVEWIAEGVSPLGEDYVAVLRRGATVDRWVDVYPNIGKRMGAFSSGSKDTPPFIFMSYNDDIYSVSTLAHELGHSMHSYLCRGTQPYVYSNYGLFQAEVASNMHQALTRRHLLATHPDPAFQMAVIDEAMANFYRYFSIMPSLARFELSIHERVEKGGALTADYLNGLIADLMMEVYGSEVVVDALDRERIGSTWAQFHTHLYSNFYVYQYATGVAAADHLVGRVASGERAAVEAYRAFLSSGGSMFPLEGLRIAGVDMTSVEPMQAAFATLAFYVQRLEELAKTPPFLG
ncbi:MAG TPA: oligoendopeptidase F [Candidatus Dormibacteraeota bacterium]|nr:oligoendopeptidase F [Candidatus Dormibacteraeota bacterium]